MKNCERLVFDFQILKRERREKGERGKGEWFTTMGKVHKPPFSSNVAGAGWGEKRKKIKLICTHYYYLWCNHNWYFIRWYVSLYQVKWSYKKISKLLTVKITGGLENLEVWMLWEGTRTQTNQQFFIYIFNSFLYHINIFWGWYNVDVSTARHLVDLGSV